MKNQKILIYLAMFMTLSLTLSAQVLDEETGFIYVKAEYLFETGRYDEAIGQYNLVISKDAKYKDALIHRGLAKYAMAAYKGAKMDAIQSIDLKGINADAAALLGRSFAAINEINPAINSLTAAIALDSKNPLYFEWRAAIYENDDQKSMACLDYENAMKLGSSMAEVKARNLCGITKSNTPKQTTPVTDYTSTSPQNTDGGYPNDEAQVDPNILGEGEVLSSGTQYPPTNSSGAIDSRIIDDSEPIIDENLPKNDNTVNSFVIDEDLSIEISGQELGKRKINEVPSILILANENGKVTINICVNKSGQVVTAEFNASMSSIAKKSLVSLALRKAKEFEFSTGNYDSQCGIMVFKIKGS